MVTVTLFPFPEVVTVSGEDCNFFSFYHGRKPGTPNNYFGQFCFDMYLEPEEPSRHHFHAGHLASRLQGELLLLHPLLLFQPMLGPFEQEEY